MPDVHSELVIDSPLGAVRLEATPKGLVALSWTTSSPIPRGAESRIAHPVLKHAVAWLRAYFARSDKTVRLPAPPRLAPEGTPFQKAVWQQLCRIPFGQTLSYGDVARAINSPGAARGVGQACGANPLPIFIPCHRVLAASGRIGGFSAGLGRKEWLLAHEGWGGAHRGERSAHGEKKRTVRAPNGSATRLQ